MVGVPKWDVNQKSKHINSYEHSFLVEDSPTQRELIIDLLKRWLKSYGSYQWNGGVGASALPGFSCARCCHAQN